ncbi:MAG: hypothetical protein WC220_01780 [Pedobacter sp.]|jgi:hypothetical protein
MKKLILSAAVIACTGFTALQAKTTENISAALYTVQDSVTKTPVELKDLPDPVKATLASDAYKEWTPIAAFHVKDSTKGTEYYHIDIKKADKTRFIRLDKEGKPIQ